ncbi:MAG: tRNA (adenosine(37)-N6)-dimethylallyltransferase MiaA, partial [Clostridiales bacterium]|nr:tRNA (adenosine(37)-N6)-dimethylallyltransferase MiaA [Clostridiales bacterium]
MKKVLVITGPTASGKTAVSMQLAKKAGGEIINADSMQIYSGCDIGSAKPSLMERQNITHHLIDIVNPTNKFSTAEYKTSAL